MILTPGAGQAVMAFSSSHPALLDDLTRGDYLTAPGR
jgi:hypothetical protein